MERPRRYQVGQVPRGSRSRTSARSSSSSPASKGSPASRCAGWTIWRRLEATVTAGSTRTFEITIDADKKRIGVALFEEGSPRALAVQEADSIREYAERSDASGGEGFGSLADKLRSAFSPKNKT